MTGSRVIIPAPDPVPWPSLGKQVCDFIQDQLVHGPGDVLGEEIVLTQEQQSFLWRMYEVFPRDHPRAGRRRFKREVLSRRKGWAKTELAAWVAIMEMDPEAPVRCDGWRQEGKMWVPIGRPVRDPYIPMLATTEEQTEDLAYGAVYAILTQDTCPLVNLYDPGLERIAHVRAPGKIVALAGAPNARDGARTTFQHFDEPHLYIAARLKKAHGTMLRNIPKRRASDPHSLETTTSFGPGEESVAEETWAYAEQIRLGQISDPTLLLDHRQAGEGHDLETKRGLRAAIKEASGDAWEFTDLEGIEALFADPTISENEGRRYWLNQARRSAHTWGPALVWEKLKVDRPPPPRDTRIVLSFHGAYTRAAAALVGATVEPVPHIFEVKSWERPSSKPNWRVPANGVVAALEEAMERWDVVELVPDPTGWHREVEDWEAIYGEPTVVRFEATRQPSRFGPACDDFEQAVSDGELTHDGSEVIARHLDNCSPKDHRGWNLVVPGVPGAMTAAAVAAIVAHHRARWHATNTVNQEVLVAWASGV